ncbi:hypothetical protein FVE85_2694 [Porphyridium purpureum]|uniref:Uncharacterized protein n=1 Tax=Porphyridium purpureum TaxID=35688 RepID=A0A5J4YUL3_PORPP|nr:hypothetical protein FVE85_2694 [Porphyridium purpureum]|eukprot:POR7544..scf227_4
MYPQPHAGAQMNASPATPGYAGPDSMYPSIVGSGGGAAYPVMGATAHQPGSSGYTAANEQGGYSAQFGGNMQTGAYPAPAAPYPGYGAADRYSYPSAGPMASGAPADSAPSHQMPGHMAYPGGYGQAPAPSASGPAYPVVNGSAMDAGAASSRQSAPASYVAPEYAGLPPPVYSASSSGHFVYPAVQSYQTTVFDVNALLTEYDGAHGSSAYAAAAPPQYPSAYETTPAVPQVPYGGTPAAPSPYASSQPPGNQPAGSGPTTAEPPRSSHPPQPTQQAPPQKAQPPPDSQPALPALTVALYSPPFAGSATKGKRIALRKLASPHMLFESNASISSTDGVSGSYEVRKSIISLAAKYELSQNKRKLLTATRTWSATRNEWTLTNDGLYTSAPEPLLLVKHSKHRFSDDTATARVTSGDMINIFGGKDAATLTCKGKKIAIYDTSLLQGKKKYGIELYNTTDEEAAVAVLLLVCFQHTIAQ